MFICGRKQRMQQLYRYGHQKNREVWGGHQIQWTMNTLTKNRLNVRLTKLP